MFENEIGLSHEEMMASGDPDLIAMAQEASGAAESESVEDDNATQSVDEHDDLDAEADADTPDDDNADAEANAEEGDTPQPDSDDDKPEGISDKQGKRIIPYAELETARKERNQFKSAVDELNGKFSELQGQYDKAMRQLELANQQGIELPTLIEDEEITEETIAELEDISPDMAKVARKMKWLIETKGVNPTDAATPTKPAPATTDVAPEHGYAKNDVLEAFKSTPGMDTIFKDSTAKQMAISIEKQVLASGEYNSLNDVYAEVVRRTELAMGKTYVPAGTKRTPPPTNQPDLPESMSDMASTRAGFSGQRTSDMDDATHEEWVSKASISQLEDELGL